MNLNPGQTRLLIIAIYLALLLGLGFFASRLFRGTKKDYLLASHSIGPFLLLMSLFGTTMTAFALVGSSGEAFKEGIGVYGMMASSSGIIHSLCFFVIGVKIWGFGRKYGYTTQIDFFRDRLDSHAVGLFLFPVLVGLIIPYLLIGVMASGTVIQGLTAGAFPSVSMFEVLTPSGEINKGLSGGIPPWLGSLAICLVVLTYVFFGGMRGTAWANAFQTVVFMVLGIVTFTMIANKMGGEESLLENLRKIMGKVTEEKSTRVGMSQTKFLTYMLIPFSVGMFPHLFQHWLTAKSANSFKVPVVCHPIFIMLVWVPCVLIGVWATTIDIPPTISPNGVLAFLVKTKVSAVLGGFLAAGILAAIMSSLDSQFLCVGTIFSTDIAGRYFGTNKWTESQQVWVSRSFIILIVAITYALSLMGYRSVFGMAVWSFSGFASLFPIVFAALYWRRLTQWGAIAAILATAGTWWYFFVQSNYGRGIEAAKGKFDPYHLYIPGTEWEIMPVVPIFLASTVALVAVSLITPPPKDETLRKFFPEKIGKSA